MTVHVTEIRAERTATNARLSARVRHLGTDGGDSQVWLCYPLECYEHLACSADPWIAMFLWPAMKLGQGLHIEAPASPLLLESTRALMDIMSCWDASYRPVEVTACGTCSDRAGGRAVASFFSGGVDSFYTAVKHTSVDAPARSAHHPPDLGEGARRQTRRQCLVDGGHGASVRIGGGTGMLLGRVRDETCREIIPGTFVPWGMYYGAVLAAIGLGLKGFWNTVLIPAAQSYADLYPGGSHPGDGPAVVHRIGAHPQ